MPLRFDLLTLGELQSSSFAGERRSVLGHSLGVFSPALSLLASKPLPLPLTLLLPPLLLVLVVLAFERPEEGGDFGLLGSASLRELRLDLAFSEMSMEFRRNKIRGLERRKVRKEGDKDRVAEAEQQPSKSRLCRGRDRM